MACTKFPKDNLVPNVTQHQVGNVTYLYKGGAPTAPRWEAITVPLAAKGVTVEGGGSVQDFIDAQYTTVAELATGKFHIGQYVRLIDRANAPFNVVSGGTPDGEGILDAGDGNTAVRLKNSDLQRNELDSLKNIYSQKLSDRFHLARNKCAVGSAYVWRNPQRIDADYRFSVGCNQGNLKTAEWDFIEDVDGFYRMRYGYVGNKRDPDIGVDATNFSQTPISSGNNSYFRASDGLGATMDVAFTGTGLIFQAFVDTRGGMWEISIDGGNSFTVSVNSDNPLTPAANGTLKQLIADGLDYGPHTASFTFIGADPDYPPSDGNARGWFKLNNISTPPDQYTGLIVTGKEFGISASGNTLVSNGILEFAINVTPTGSGFATDWVPAHGSATGAMVVNSRTMYVDSVRVDDYSTIPEREIAEFTMIQEYTAYNTNSSLTLPMWNGVLITKFDRLNGLTYSHEYTTLRDLDVLDGYSAMVSGRRTSDLLTLKHDNGYVIDISGSTPLTQINHYTKKLTSTMYEGVNNILAMKSNSPQASSNIGGDEVDYNATLTTERTDGFVKTYYKQLGTNKTVGAGKTFTSSHSIWMGIK